MQELNTENYKTLQRKIKDLNKPRYTISLIQKDHQSKMTIVYKLDPQI